jgi:hypothetical protein
VKILLKDCNCISKISIKNNTNEDHSKTSETVKIKCLEESGSAQALQIGSKKPNGLCAKANLEGKQR